MKPSDITFRPISRWPDGPEPPAWARRTSPFRSTEGQTMRLLAYELSKLGATRAVVELAINEMDLRVDGRPKVAAQYRHPGVVVSFDSDHGPLRYATAEYADWRQNLRAVALGLEALRRVDRYGITKRGEQYTGFRALSAGGPSADRGRQLIAQHGSVRAALSATHPDHGGSADDFADVQAAREEGG